MAIVTPALSAAKDTYGAIAYSQTKRGIVFNTECSQSETCQQGALKTCGEVSKASDCKVLIWFVNNCAAFANATNGHYGAAWSPTIRAAET
jgi:hypothetical protein